MAGAYAKRLGKPMTTKPTDPHPPSKLMPGKHLHTVPQLVYNTGGAAWGLMTFRHQ